jgi:MFS family permease
MVGATFGSMFEWYDFFLASTAAATVWPRIFFPTRFDPVLALAVSVMSVGIGYFARPVGAFVFGHLGDKYGRRNTLVWTLIMMGISALGTAVLPPYASIGVLAVVLLFILRFLVGFGVGGEAGGAWSWIAEAKPDPKHRGFWVSWPDAMLQAGKLLSIFAFFLAASFLSNDAYVNWGWRVPFAAGAVMLLVGYVIRLKLIESPMFQELQTKRTILKYPAIQVLKEQGRKIFTMLWLNAYATAIPALVILPYSVSYLVKLGADESFATLSVTAGTAVACTTVLGGAYVSDYVGRLKVVVVGAILTIVIMYPYFFLLNSLNHVWIIIAQMLIYGSVQLGSGALKGLFVESFPTKYRYSGAGLTYTLGGLVTGGIAGILLPLLLVSYGVIGSWQPVIWASMGMAIMALVSVPFVKETRGIRLE